MALRQSQWCFGVASGSERPLSASRVYVRSWPTVAVRSSRRKQTANAAPDAFPAVRASQQPFKRANSAAARLRAVRCSDGLGISLRSDHHAVHRQPPIVKYKPNLRTVLLRTDVQMRFQSIAGVANPAERLSQRYRIAKRYHRTAPHQMGHKYLYVSTLHSDVVRGTLRIGRSGRL